MTRDLSRRPAAQGSGRGRVHRKKAFHPQPLQRDILRRAFVDEDEPMVRAVQQAMGDRDFFELAPAILESDVAAISARRALAKLIREEKDAANSKHNGPPPG